MKRRLLALVLVVSAAAFSQAYSPRVLKHGQPDPHDLAKFAAAIYKEAGARTPRERAEAIWRFFLTDGRFVAPGFWYHIAGWAYEEPYGEVLDPLKLLNSYGFGLCYHIAPLLEAVFEAGGFEDARVWFLTGHTVAEVFYDGSYHYFDSDMMGYNVEGNGPHRGKRVVSVRDLEQNKQIIVGKLTSPTSVREGEVDEPWYPADVRAAAMKSLASLFTTTEDNYLFPHTRYARGHEMNYVLRPGERITHYFYPEEPGLFYLPRAFDGKQWRAFPREIPRYNIRTADGPRSQKDDRRWGTGSIEYTPAAISAERTLVYDMPSPWVVIDAEVRLQANLPSNDNAIVVEMSEDGKRWDRAAELQGPFRGHWPTGRLTAVSGKYGYKVRITRRGAVPPSIDKLTLSTRFQINPRTLPAIEPGRNRMTYRTAAPQLRQAIPVSLADVSSNGLKHIDEDGQSFLVPEGQPGYALVEISAKGRPLTGFDAGARFLELRGNLAPDKLTAETRQTAVTTKPGGAWIEWSLSPEGPWKTVWTYDGTLKWRDSDKIDRTLLWPEAFVQVRDLPAGTKRAFVRFRSAGPAVDSIRTAALAPSEAPAGRVLVTHEWTENGAAREHREQVDAAERAHAYIVAAGDAVRNHSISYEMLP